MLWSSSTCRRSPKGSGDFTTPATDYNAYPYSYYRPAYESTVARSGVRYSDAYGPRYYTRTAYGDW